MRYVFKHILRAPVKSILVVAVALFFIVALDFLQNTIDRFETEVERLFDTTVVTGEVRRSNPLDFRPRSALMQNHLMHVTVRSLLETGFFQSYYAEAGYRQYFIIPPNEDGSFPAYIEGFEGCFWDAFTEYALAYYEARYAHYDEDDPFRMDAWTQRYDPLFSVNCLYALLEEHGAGEGRVSITPDFITRELAGFGMEQPPPLEITFAPGFSGLDWVYRDSTLQTPIPIIVHEGAFERTGVFPTTSLRPGDYAFIGRPFNPNPNIGNAPHHETHPVIIIGTHNGGIMRPNARSSALIPFYALEQLRGDILGYMVFRFEIDTALNREMNAVRDELHSLTRNPQQNEFIQMDVIIRDEELRVVVGQMEQNLSLLQMLYPIAIGISAVIGAGLGTLLLLQNAKNAAVMRVLGLSKRKARMMLWAELVIVCLAGSVIGLLILAVARQGITMPLLAAVIPYLTGAAVGAAVGAVLVTNRAPLDLLQVRE